jgi:hypothetical protein
VKTGNADNKRASHLRYFLVIYGMEEERLTDQRQ